ncbi:hypothetical protein [Alicyclobacillus herbarius]|uniref:hypothetical protein n=1 Tax=Alicyclobacillus herbarius TaxID=122960 RepID=UPI000403F21B|nr:hypothetical protein [Alicyclobacillus herbarius]
MAQKSKVLTFILSGLPGLGHLYLGLNKRGLQFMVGFFACIVLTSFIPIVFPFAAAVLWFYALFDALQKVTLLNAYAAQGKAFGENAPSGNESDMLADLDQAVVPIEALQGKGSFSPLWLGGICIVIGILVLIRQAFPEVWWVFLQARVGTILLAAALIGFGIWLIRTQWKNK